MSQKFYPQQIKHLLNRSLTQLDQPTLSKLRDARENALARYATHRTAPAFAWAGLWTNAAGSHHRSHFWAAAVLLVAILFSCTAYWHHTTDHDVSDVDIAILTDDLPIEVYVD